MFEEQDANRKLIEEFKILGEKFSNGTVNALDYFLPKIAPTVIGHNVAKTAGLVWAASLDEIGSARGRMHCLQYGSPGTAKSQLLRFWTNELNCVSAGPRSTKAGLTASMSGRSPEPGILVRASGKGYATLDEVHAFGDKDRQAMLEAMEEGCIRIAGGGHIQKLPATCRIMANANRVHGWSPELLDRFDFKVYFRPYTRDEAKHIAANIVEQDVVGDSKPTGVGAYVYWARRFVPTTPPEIKRRAGQLLEWVIDELPDTTVGIRDIRTFQRTWHSLARLNQRNVTEEDVIRGIDLCVGVKNSQNDFGI